MLFVPGSPWLPRYAERIAAAQRRHGVRAAKSIGQHFLVDRGALSAIVDAADTARSKSPKAAVDLPLPLPV